MHMQAILNAQLDRFRELYRPNGPVDLQVLETGTIRQDTEEHRQGDGWSTLAFAADAAVSGGHVTSIDLFTDTAEKVLTRERMGAHVTLRTGCLTSGWPSML
jgi:hypothetical protein